MSVPLISVMGDAGVASNTPTPALSKERLLELYRVMVLTRVLDDRAMKLQRQGRIGFYVPAIGQEASHIGTAAALEKDDWVFPSYRDPGIALLRGVPVVELLHQCYGNSADHTLGRQMPVHYSLKKIRFVSISSPIGTQIVQAAGAAMAMKVEAVREKRAPHVAITYFGDGSTSSNDFHTGLNFAGVFAAPCIFVCENNGWAISVPLEGQTASATMAAKAEAYGMPGIRVDGNDVLAVYAATREAVERARAGKGPTLIETVTFRIGGHSSSDDPSRYRDPKVCEVWKGRDPIDRFKRWLEGKKLLSAAQDAAIREQCEKELTQAIDAAEKVGPPAVSTMFEDVFAGRTAQLDAQWAELKDALQRGVVAKGHHGEFPL
ncbi:MAG: pyruvate dehydrogenase (acetyl-transferring) E1 component subunit alpha [Planctomycetes bacterium]|nr:pyruvate dehydrogenase (acetyl-transferring) E1 component subunit alpha [Planctomycetota bacterium]